MKPIDFKQRNRVWMGDGEEIADLYVFQDNTEIVSCWKPSLKERLFILLGYPVWLSILGHQQPAVFLTSENIFDENKDT